MSGRVVQSLLPETGWLVNVHPIRLLRSAESHAGRKRIKSKLLVQQYINFK